jgi:hypothetical protein
MGTFTVMRTCAGKRVRTSDSSACRTPTRTRTPELAKSHMLYRRMSCLRRSARQSRPNFTTALSQAFKVPNQQHGHSQSEEVEVFESKHRAVKAAFKQLQPASA